MHYNIKSSDIIIKYTYPFYIIGNINYPVVLFIHSLILSDFGNNTFVCLYLLKDRNLNLSANR